MKFLPEAASPVRVSKASVMSFWQKAIFSLIVAGSVLYLVRYLLWWIRPEHIPRNLFIGIPSFDLLANLAIFSILTFVVFIGSLLRVAAWFAIWFAAKPKFIPAPGDLRVALVTCFVPGREPYEMLESTLCAMLAVRYNHDTWVLDEGNDPVVRAMCKRLGVKHFSRHGILKYNQDSGVFRTKTKAGNHNSWRDCFEKQYDIVGQIDVDNAPHPDYFERTLGYFCDKQIGLVVMPQVYKNQENWIARGAAEQAYFFHGPMQMGFYGSDMPFLIGTSHIYRTFAMNQIGGYAPTIVEDHLTGMNFYSAGWKGVFVPEILAEGEGPQNWIDYFNQQMRWSYGLFEILFKYTPKVIWNLGLRQKLNYFFAQLYYFTGTAVFLGIVLTVLYLVFGVRAASMNLTEWILHAAPPFSFAILVQIFLHRFHITPRKEPLFGLLGMFLNVGANLVYTVALISFILGRRLKYVVTPKGSSAKNNDVPVRAFYLHIGTALLCLSALILSFVGENGAVQLRFWALFNTVIFLAIAISNYWARFYTYLKSYRYVFLTLRLGFNLAVAVFVISALTLGFVQKEFIAQAFIAKDNEVRPVDNVLVPMASRLKAPEIGASIGVSLYQSNDLQTLDMLEESLDRKFSFVGYYQSWGVENNRFNFDNAQNISNRGAIPLITWEPWRPIEGFSRKEQEINQEDFRLKKIIDGQYDSYIENYARDVKAYRKPVLVRFAHEMNGNWYPWGSTLNAPQEYVLAWRHVHDIFDEVGATNVTWVWAPNEIYYEKTVPYSSKIEEFYPGSSYVDWVGFSSFNWGKSYKQNIWRTPSDLFDDDLEVLGKFGKPIIIAETASSDWIGNAYLKSSWISQLSEYMIAHPEVKGVIWFNTVDGGVDWTIDSTQESVKSFKESFSSPYFK